jgi:hypothetical protein
MVINQNLIGKEFHTDVDTSTTWKVEGVLVHGTVLILGSTWDQASNRTRLHLFNLKEIKFKGQF